MGTSNLLEVLIFVKNHIDAEPVFTVVKVIK